MAGRKPINSVRTSKVRTQIVLRAFEADVEQRTDTLRLIELVEQKKGEGTLPQFIAKALLNQMLSDEGGRPKFVIDEPLKGGGTSLSPQRVDQAAPAMNEKALEVMARGMLAKLMAELGLQGGARGTDVTDSTVHQDQTQVAPGRIEFGLDRSAEGGDHQQHGLNRQIAPSYESTTSQSEQRLVDHAFGRSNPESDPAGEKRDNDPSPPKKRMGGNALKAMG